MSRRVDRIIRGIVRELQRSFGEQSQIDVEIEDDGDGCITYRAIVKAEPPERITMIVTTEGLDGTT